MHSQCKQEECLIITHTHSMHAALVKELSTLPGEDHIQNFKAIDRNLTHVTFSWDVVDGQYSSNHINYFQMHYKDRTANWSSLYIPYIITTQTRSPNPTFHFTTRIATFGKPGQYIMQLSVYRHRLVPRTLYSAPVHVDLGKAYSHNL